MKQDAKRHIQVALLDDRPIVLHGLCAQLESELGIRRDTEWFKVQHRLSAMPG